MGEESLSSTSFSFHHSGVDDSDAYFDLDLRPHSLHHHHHHHLPEFEFRLSFSALVPFPGFTTAAASLSSIPPPPSPPPATPCEINNWGLVHTRKVVQGSASKSTMMMKFLVKIRSIVSVRGGETRVERWLRKQRIMKEEGHQIMTMPMLTNNKFFRNPFIPTASSSSSTIISSPPLFPHQPVGGKGGGGGDHASSLLHSAIAHCNKSWIP